MTSSFENTYLGRLRKHVGHEVLLSPGVQIVLRRRDGRVLIQRRTDSGLWEIPAGSCEPGQSFRTAAAAELAEETGIVVDPDGLTAFASFSDPVDHLLTYPNGDLVHAFALCFVADAPDLDPHSADGEAIGHRWVLPAALPDPAHGPTRAVLAMLEEYERTGEFQAR